MTNRVLCFLHSPAERQRRRAAAAESQRDRINDLCCGIVESYIVSDEDVRLGFQLMLEIPSTAALKDAAKHLATELLTLADGCLIAADRLESKGGAA